MRYGPAVQEEQQGRALDPIRQWVDDAAQAQQHGQQETGEGPAPRAFPKAPISRETLQPDPPGTFYTYTDPAGVSHIVDSPLRIPQARQHTAKRWVSPGASAKSGASSMLPEGLTNLARQV